ncbi:hypothetical protein [Magnetospirillum sp. 64-120]|uniref:tetratricopeptide repeat protein n=1 Tax=Magnetospirillum sp. 64-120 TaxID=1895778 RepID=UPI00092B6508|nr:hypothetical protein [Magnetospirillum sp. 64-120]OJX73852.1 MAG: hypothetical protein BGO92_04890 [Magnetospirillum sp. 64-120]
MGGTTLRLAGCVALAAMTAACQTVREQENTAVKPEVVHTYLAGKPKSLEKHFYVSLIQGPRNQVLNDMRLGLASMELGDDKLAESLLDDALGRIESIYVDNPDAAKARELFTKELVKDFKGEPYERAMAYYYRGLLYLKAGDYDNARASFKGGFIQDSFADEDQNQADFGLMQYLQGWASRCRGNNTTAADDFAEFKKIKPDFPLPADGDNTLLLVETGQPPVKFSAAAQGETKEKFLKYRRASGTEVARLSYSEEKTETQGKGKSAKTVTTSVSHKVEPQLLEDVFYQASTRGGRPFDAVLAGKAQFQDAASTVGDVALTGAMVAASVAASNNHNNQGEAAAVAGALLLVGLLAKGAAEAAEPDADTRYWDNLPDRVHAASLKLPERVTSLSVDFLAADGTYLRTREAKVTRAGACGIAWVRGDSAQPANPRAPYSTSKEAMVSPVVIPGLPAPAPERAEPVKRGPEQAETEQPKS